MTEFEIKMADCAERYVRSQEMALKAQQQAWEAVMRLVQNLGPMLPALMGFMKP